MRNMQVNLLVLRNNFYFQLKKSPFMGDFFIFGPEVHIKKANDSFLYRN